MACEYLILNSADVNVQDFYGQTPLYFATQLSKFKIYNIFIILCFIFFDTMLFNIVFV